MALRAIDFFCGAGGMSYGLARSGIKIVAGIDCDPACKPTYEHNNKPARFLERDIATLNPVELAACWRVLRIWEHELARKNQPRLVRRIQRVLQNHHL